ncbi:MAG: SIMPL domain-containing protein [Fibrobacter sp.]|nr:SIMPL domain-containing protein [Fibrobacter sp.]
MKYWVTLFLVLVMVVVYFSKEKVLDSYIEVSGMHEETFKSDAIVWTLQFSVTGEVKDSLFAQKEMQTKKLLLLSQTLGVDSNAIVFDNYSLRKEWFYENGKTKGFVYRLSQKLTTTLNSMEASDLFSDGLIALNDFEVLSIDYDLQGKNEKLNAISLKAFENAKAKAEKLASVSGKTLKEVLAISETPFNNEWNARPLAMSRVAFSENGPKTTKLSSQVFVRFVLK